MEPNRATHRKCLYKHSINPIYVKQCITYHFKKYVRLGTCKYDCTRGQLNIGGGQLHEVKRSRDKTELGKMFKRKKFLKN